MPVRPVAIAAAQQAFQKASVTSLGPGTKTPPKHNLHGRKNPTQNLTKQLQTDQNLSNQEESKKSRQDLI
jgi:hypothetical protein